MAEVRWTNQAVDGLEAAVIFIAPDSLQHARPDEKVPDSSWRETGDLQADRERVCFTGA